MPLSHDELLHVAKLARLRVEAEELPELAVGVNAVLEYVAKLGELDISDVPELAHGAGLENVFRADAVESASADVRARIVESFPAREGALLRVPSVFDR